MTANEYSEMYEAIGSIMEELDCEDPENCQTCKHDKLCELLIRAQKETLLMYYETLRAKKLKEDQR